MAIMDLGARDSFDAQARKPLAMEITPFLEREIVTRRLAPGEKLAPANYKPLAVREGGLATAPPIDLRRWLLPAALVGLLVDALISIWLMGGAPMRRKGALATLVIVGALGLATVPHQARAGDAPPISDRDMDAALSRLTV